MCPANPAPASDPVIAHRHHGPAGKSVVLIHSLGCDLALWDPVVALLPAAVDFLRYDLRGHGRSESPAAETSIEDHVSDLLTLLDNQKIPRAVLVGNSVGGLISLAVAARRPDRCRALVLSATGPRIGTAAGWNARIAAVRDHGLAPVADSILARWFAPDFATRHPGRYADARAMLLRTPAEGYIATCAALRDTDLVPELPRITAPSLVLAGEHDTVCPPISMRHLAAALPQSHFEVIRDCGHLPPLEQPGAYVAALTRFLESLP